MGLFDAVVNKTNKTVASKKLSSKNKKTPKNIIKKNNSNKTNKKISKKIIKKVKLDKESKKLISNKKKIVIKEWVKTRVEGFDELLDKGIPKNSSILLSGGPGSGKTIFGLQTCYFNALKGKKCMYMSFEESIRELKEHMKVFGWDYEKVKDKMELVKQEPFRISRYVEGLLAKAKGELLEDFNPKIFPKNFKPEILVIDSLSAIESAFFEKEDNYRIYIEQLFNYLDISGVTSYLITEIQQEFRNFNTKTGVEEFLADGVFVFYNTRRQDLKERSCEVLKLRGVNHITRIVPFKIVDKKGIVVYPEERTFNDVEGEQ